MSLALLFHCLLLNMFRMLIHPSSGACDLFDELLHGLYGSDLMCVGVALWWCGIRMQAEALVVCSSGMWGLGVNDHHNVTPTHIKPEQDNPRNNSSNKSQAPEDGCINIQNMLSIK